ncbi:MAG: DNA mismatch repair endonuclease MutL [Thermoplasmata archaeon]
MSEIKLLSPHTINQIAAGEVIERPASLVKELIENSLDADADVIHVQVKNGGKDLIRVTDNGRGMSREDLKLAFKKHATSKIKDMDDLDRLSSLGFRGEALPSIASVSRIMAVSKERGALEGYKLCIHGGTESSFEEVGAPEGTTIEAADLFFNTPARRRYLKKNSTEVKHIIEVVTRYSLAYTDVEFKLQVDGNESLFVPKTNSTLENIKYIYGKEIARKMVKIRYQGEDIDLKGYVSKPSVTRSNREHIYTFVNGRYVKNRALKDAVVSGYSTLLLKHRYPIAIIKLKLDESEVDVNVHPTKIKVRFQEEGEIKEEVEKALNYVLLEHDLIPTPTEESPEMKPKKKETKKDLGSQTKLEMDEEREVLESSLPRMRVLGIIQKSYIVVEMEDGMAVVDQHAAHERINYENIKRRQKDVVESQSLVSPVTVDLMPKEAALVRSNEELLKQMGFGIEPFGKTTFRITALPVILGELQADDVLYSVLDELYEIKGKPMEDRREELICYMACHSSFTAGDDISITTARYLLDKLGQTENPYTCPHGRPTIIRFQESEIKKWFKRT